MRNWKGMEGDEEELEAGGGELEGGEDLDLEGLEAVILRIRDLED